ncbi:PAS domain-containing protein, partial [Dubosiella newyorkensis]
LTFIDENDQLRFFTNEGKVFSRPHSALNRKVFDCHPPQLIPVVQDMLETFKAKKNDRVERWIPNPERPVKVVYQALYDSQDRYIGTLEMVQSFEHEKNILRSFQTDPKEL